MNLDNIILEDEQKDLFIQIAEIIKSVPRENRSSMIEANSSDGTCLIMPTNKSGKSNNIKGFAHGDLDTFADAGLLRIGYGSKGGRNFTVTPAGFKYYEWLLKKQEKTEKDEKKKAPMLPDLDQISSSLREVLTKVDHLKKEADTLLPAKEEFKEKFEKKVRLEWNYHSNKLEGNELSYGETRELLYHDKTSGKKLKDHRELIGHDEAITYVEEMVSSGEPFTEKFIRELNKKVLKEPYKREALASDGKLTTKTIHPGQYKTTPNHVKTKTGDVFKFAEPNEVPQKMEELVAWYREEHSYSLIQAGELHYRFVNIHPFDDGNGRVARLLMNYCLMEYGFPPVVIKTEQKDEYHSCLRKADTGEFESLFIFLGECLLDSIQLYIDAAKGKTINDENDLDKWFKVFERKLEEDERDEIKTKRNTNDQLKRFDDSIWPLITEFASQLKRFSKFFAEFNISSVIDNNGFEGSLEEIRVEFRSAITRNSKLRNIQVSLQFKGFKKGGVNALYTSFRLPVEFQDYGYIINSQNNKTKGLPTIEKYYHQKIGEETIKDFANRAGMLFKEQLDSYYDQISSKNS